MPANPLSPMRRQLLRWYGRNQRDLPWRRTQDPYAIWIAETMLQQTQVKTVLPYYDKFMSAFPSVEALAKTPLRQVLRHWSGLGYYRRAENLHKAARLIRRNHGGVMPRRYDQLRALPGIGDYTAGALLSIAFNQPYPAIDGNVRRVFSRLLAIVDEKTIRATATALITKSQPGTVNQALMELGALVCAPQQPRCSVCPVAAKCSSRAGVGKRKLHRPATKFRAVTWPLAILRQGRAILLRRRPDHGLLAKLWELPGGEIAARANVATALRRQLAELSIARQALRPIGAIRHSIGNRRIRAPLFLLDCPANDPLRLPSKQWRWIEPRELQRYAISSMTAKAVKLIITHEKSPA